MSNQGSLSRRWKAQLRDLGLISESTTARTYRVKQLDVMPSLVRVVVQDRDTGSCTIEIQVASFTDEQWQRLIDAFASQTMLAAQVISGSLSPEVEHVANDAAGSLLPVSANEFISTCTCCSPGGCRHLSLIYTLLGEMLDDDPWLLFMLRGRDRQQVLREVRAGREAGHTAPAVATGASEAEGATGPTPRTDVAPFMPNGDPSSNLAGELKRYWGDRKLLKQFQHHIAPPSVELSLLRRLGPLTSTAEGMAVYEQLVVLYRSVTEEALALAYATNEDD
jgi:uncharacterized Zn finger protein